MIVYGLVVPGIAIVVAMWLWHQAKDRPTTIIAVVLIVPGFAWLAWTLYGGEKRLLDQQVRELCAKDGGIKVYETVKLPAELLDKNGVIRIPDKEQAKPTDQYYYETERRYYRNGNPELSRRQYRIVRRVDQKILGELVFYGRGGGDLPGPWHESGITCPDPTQIPNFETSIFLRN
jgi:hypothetical protein